MKTASDYEIRIIRSLDEIEGIRKFWNTHQYYPDADIDFYIAYCNANKEKVRPHITILLKQGSPCAMLIGRVDHTDFKFRFGYKVLFSIRVRSLNILYGGIFGNPDDLGYDSLLEGIMQSLSTGEADVAFFNHLISDSYLCRIVRKRPSYLVRDHSSKSYIHWKAVLPDSFDSYYRTRSKKFKRTINLANNRTNKQYGRNQSVSCLQIIDEFGRIIDDVEMIASKTYHRGMSTGFINNDATRDRVRLALERKLYRAYIMYLDQKPCAFMMGMKYGGVFFPQATGYDPYYTYYSPGTLIILEMFKLLFEEGDIHAVDFGFGEAFYKHNFCNENWQESPVYIYAPSFKGVSINAIKSLLDVISNFAENVLKKTNFIDKIKKKWRGKLAGRTNEANTDTAS